jgi:hypothetical protein
MKSAVKADAEGIAIVGDAIAAMGETSQSGRRRY